MIKFYFNGKVKRLKELERDLAKETINKGRRIVNGCIG